MSRACLALGAVLATAAAVAAAGCRNGGQKPPDTGADGGPPDAPPLSSLEVAVTGCASCEPGNVSCPVCDGMAPPCVGFPPLSLAFTPVGSQHLTQFMWTFGDGTASVTERAPSHTYLLPGCYQVRLVGRGSAGTVEPPQPLTISVLRLPTGAPCDVDAQCEGTLECACAPGKGCAPAFTHGLCSHACDTKPCRDGVCAALALASGPVAGVPVRGAHCVAACADNRDCAVGFECSTLRATGVGAAAGWVRGCLPVGAQRDLGASCRNENEVLDPDLCGTGLCADVGALGVCSASCDANPPLCPAGATCAQLPDGRDLCLAPCVTNDDCARDPLLACTSGLTTDGGVGSSVCAPRACTTDDDCAPSGRCPDAVCVRR